MKGNLKCGQKHTPETFWARIDITSKKECWEWQGARNTTGYGLAMYQGVKTVAHRIAYFLFHNQLPTSAPKDRTSTGFILHSCDNPACCNPHHLRLGTYSENQQEAYDRKRRITPGGMQHHNSKLTWEEADEIRQKHKEGRTKKSLAQEYGVSPPIITNITTGVSYK